MHRGHTELVARVHVHLHTHTHTRHIPSHHPTFTIPVAPTQAEWLHLLLHTATNAPPTPPSNSPDTSPIPSFPVAYQAGVDEDLERQPVVAGCRVVQRSAAKAVHGPQLHPRPS
eukprot:2089816-Rhodomonas_salina.1